jgi:hypothetical protein
MKQLKIIVPQIDTQNPFFSVNFTESVTIDPDSRIAFDKISFNIVSSGPDGSIQLGGQTIAVAPNILTGPLSQGYREVYLAPAIYQNIDELYRALQTALNGCLNSNPYNLLSGKMPDTGLSFLVNSAPAAADMTEIAFVQAEVLNQADGVATNLLYDGNAFYVPEGAGLPWSLIYPQPLLAGALQCNTSVYFPNVIQLAGNEMFIGLYTQPNPAIPTTYTPAFGLYLDVTGVWYFYNNGDLIPIPDQAAFTAADPLTNLWSWFVDPNDGAHLRVAIFETTPAGEGRAIITELLISPALTFQGYNVNTNYFFGADGIQNIGAFFPVQVLWPAITYQPNVNLTNAGWLLNTGESLNVNYKGLAQLTYGALAPFPKLEVVSPRNVRINFTNAQALMQGLGFTNIVNNIVGLSGSITGHNPVGFLNFFDLALDCYNFTLDSYISSPATKGRNMAIGYFVPVPTSTISGQTMFYAENKQLVFIDIKNKKTQTIESLQMRMYNPQNPAETFLLTNVSFTLFIESSLNDGILVRQA